MRRFPARRAALLAAVLGLSTITPGFFAAALAEGPTVTLSGLITAANGLEIYDEIALFAPDGTQVDHDSVNYPEPGFSLEAPPGQYTLRLETPTPTHSDGFQSGDGGAPGLILDVPIELTENTTVDWTLPIVDFPVHVVTRDGDPVSDLWVEGDSARTFELAPGLIGSGRLYNANAVRSDSAGNATLLAFEGAAPNSLAATDQYEVLGRVSPAASDTSAVLVLNNPVIEGDLLDGRGPLPSPSADHAWVSLGSSGGAGQFYPAWPYGFGNSYSIQGDPGDRTLYVSNKPRGDAYEDPAEPRPATATLPGTWSFHAPYHHAADATIDLTIPDAAPADIVVLGADDRPVTGVTMQYSAAAQNTVELAPGITANATASDTIGDAAGHFAPTLFGPSTLTFTVDGGPVNGPFTISPGEHLTVRLDNPSNTPGPPQDVTAEPRDGRIKVTWEPPAFDGGSPITGYTVTASRNSSNHKASFGPDATSGAIRSLINGKTYSVTVVAKNANGSGTPSPKITVTLPDDDPPATTTTTTAPPLGGAGTGDDNDGPGTTVEAASGYWLLDASGAVYPFGAAVPYGDASDKLAAAWASGVAVRAVDLEPTPSMKGYWVLDSAGRVHPFGDAPHLGDVAAGRLSAGEEPATLSATPSGAGYWVFTNRGRAIAFGDAADLGDMTGTTLNGPVLDSVATPSGKGYYMVAADGGIFAFGDARFAGSMGGRRLNAPVRSLVPDGDGNGYWLVAADGGVFAFDGPFVGSMGGHPLNKPVRGMVRYGNGYLMVAEDGGVFAFSDLPFTGSLGARPPASPIVSVAALA